MTNKTRRAFSYITLALLFFANPCLNVIDVLPDFIGFFLVAALIRRSEFILPYAAEVKSSLIKLGFFSIAKIPASFILFANLGTGSDIVPLFTLIFDFCELLLIIPFINNLFSCIYYLGERSCDKLLLPIIAFGKEFNVERLKTATLAFVIARAAINFLPELCLLTYTDAYIIRLMRKLYPPLMVCGILISLAIGILWFILANAYKKTVRDNVDIPAAIDSLAGEEGLALAVKRQSLKSICSAITLLAVSSAFTFELCFKDFNRVNLLPHFVYYLILVYLASRLFSDKRVKLFAAVSGAAASVIGTVAHYFTIRFFDSYTLTDLIRNKAAAEAYLPIQIFSVIETVFAVLLCLAMALGICRFVIEHTGVLPGSERYLRPEKEHHKRLSIRMCVIFGISALLSVAKCIQVFLNRRVEIIWSNDIDNPVVESGAIPWFGTVLVALSVILIIVSFYFLSELREDVKLKYSEE